MNTNDKIKKYRKEKGLTQKQLGELSSINEVQIRQYEGNRANPKLDTIKKIAKALEVPYTDLLEDFPIEEVQQSFLNYAYEIAKKRDIFDIDERLKKLGYHISLTLDENVHTSKITIGGVEIAITDKELKTLEKDSDDYLKFKLIELRNKKVHEK